MNNKQSIGESEQPTNPSSTENSNELHKAPFVVTDRVRKEIAGAIAEVDLGQIRLLRTKTIAVRVQMAFSMVDAAEQVGAYRLRQREPELSEGEALRIVRGGLLNYARQKRNP